MSLRKKLELNWHGKAYSLLVTMEVIDKIEESVNIGRLLAQQTTGDIRFSHIAKFISLILQQAGADVSQGDVYEGMFTNGDITPENLHVFMGNIFSAFFPTQKKKVVKRTPKKAQAKASHGKTSTS